MHNTDLDEEHKNVYTFVQEKNKIMEIDYLSLQVGKIFFVRNKTGGYTLYKKTEDFNDDFLQLVPGWEEAEKFVKNSLV